MQSELIFADIKRTVEDAEDIDVSIFFEQVGNAVMAVKENSHMAARCPIAMAHLRKVGQHLRPLIYAVYGLGSRLRIIRGNVLEDILEPTLSF